MLKPLFAVRAEPHASRLKLLLTFDAHRAHTSVRILTLLLEKHVIAYELSAHTSGALQPCDAAVFMPFKEELNEVLASLEAMQSDEDIDMCEFCGAICVTYVRGSHLST